ncbi:MAG TPA: hypothetical protein VKP11_07730, partial [Frankiaceae bacterium]|nr:hypothetical protein [Frankiaceae bacterium]
MPCFRCAARQTDPVRGASPWRRGVVAGYQVLVCPGCQQSPGWADVLDRCQACGSTHLVKALGTVTCRACGAEAPAPAGHRARRRLWPVNLPATPSRAARRPGVRRPGP